MELDPQVSPELEIIMGVAGEVRTRPRRLGGAMSWTSFASSCPTSCSSNSSALNIVFVTLSKHSS